MQSQPHPLLASLSSTARYQSPVRTSDGGSGDLHQHQLPNYSSATTLHGSPLARSPEEYPHAHRQSSPTRSLAGGDNGSATAMSAKRRRTARDGDRDSEEPHGGNKKMKVLSCTECKRRKVKCDRKIPCLACCKRGEPEACRWPDETDKPQVDVQPFALTGDLLVLARRIQSLEEWAQSLPAEMRQAAPLPQGFEPSLYGTTSKHKAQELGTHVRSGKPRSRSHTATKADYGDDASFDAPSRELSETEDAALQLESMAFATRHPDSHYRPLDTLPFIDNAASPSSATLLKRSNPDAQSSQARELTAWGTSILAQPLAYEGPWSGTALGLDLCFSLEALRARFSAALATIWPHMPDRNLSLKLVAKYFDEVAWVHAVFHRATFEAEHARAWEMIEAGRRDEIDPLWLCCYFLVLSLAVDGLRSNEHTVELTQEETARCNSMVWYACAHRLIQLGNGIGRAQVRFVMATILIGQWLQTSKASGRVTAFLTMLAGAMRTAQILGLHQLGSDPAHMPLPDPAWPPTVCSMRRETALRLFHILLFYDCMSASTRFRSFLLDPRHCTTPEPSNLNWSDLSITDWRIEPKPRSTLSDMSFEYAKSRSSEAYRLAFDKLLSGSADLSYTTILELDRTYRSVLRESTQALQDSDSGVDGKVTVNQWKRLICEDGLHSRLIRLHRPFMTQYDTSRKACIESATQLLYIHSRIAPMSRMVWFVYVHSLSAAICLFVDLFHAIDHDRPAEEIEERRSVLGVALDIFSHSDQVRSPSLRAVVETGLGIIRGLLEASEARRTARAAQALLGGKAQQQRPMESFAAILQRLSRQLAVDAQASPAKPAAMALAGSSAPAQQLSSLGYTAHLPQPPAEAQLPVEYNGASFGAPNDLSYLGGTSAEYMPTEFFRDVGLTPGVGFGLDYLGTGFPSMAPFDANGYTGSQTGVAPFDPSQTGSGGANEGGGVNAPYDWPAFAAGEATEEQGKLAASALMDQLSTGLW